ncbi:hypothetical protein K2173_011732 [Erythroxylum novogranatense]|uniref:Protein kinase domain-containing protein n=1 Tax=Erythroxylum novogranatense TaxID=1862640 RepID=A0AAV8TL87_9ROSI|nr:hypothetical protein K2173_011732 [Erythroxylum novogranatense]
MGLVAKSLFQLVNVCLIGLVFTVEESAGYIIPPSPVISSEVPPTIQGIAGPVHQGIPLGSNTPSSENQPNVLDLHPLPALPPFMPVPVPQSVTGPVPSHLTTTPIMPPSYSAASPPLILQRHGPTLSPTGSITSPSPKTAPPPSVAQVNAPLMPPEAHQIKKPVKKHPVSPSNVPVESPSSNLPQNSTFTHHDAPITSPGNDHIYRSFSGVPIPEPISSVAPPPRNEHRNKPVGLPLAPARIPSISPVPVGSPENEMSHNAPSVHPTVPGESPSTLPGPGVSHSSIPSPGIDQKRTGTPVIAPPHEMAKSLPPQNYQRTEGPGSSHAFAPVRGKHGIPLAAPPDETPQPLPPVAHPPAKVHKAVRPPSDAPVTSRSSSSSKGYQSPASPPSIPFHKKNRTRNNTNHPAAALSHPIYPPSSNAQGPSIPPFLRAKRHTHYASPAGPGPSASGSHGLFPKPATIVSPAPSPSPKTSVWIEMPILSPPGSSPRGPKKPFLPPVQALPPPPPNEDCSTTVCMEPHTNTPAGSPCGCVLPMQVGLRLSVGLYTFFPLVSELAQEIAAGVFMKQSQVRIMGANAASQQPEKTIVLIDLVPVGENFDNTTAFLTFQRFWKKLVVIKTSLFGVYEVLYIRYPGLPAPPPSASSNINIVDDVPYSGIDNNARTFKPLGVDVRKMHHKDRLGGGMIAVIVLSAFVALVLCCTVAWVLLFKHNEHDSPPAQTLQPLSSAVPKPSGTTGSTIRSGGSSASVSFGSSVAPYTGSAKTFSRVDIERATNNFDASRILGEGGFGRVYNGVLKDGTKVAVKVLKRDDQQGGREFLAEVEMLSRLHHRNLVKLIGICTEHARSLVYELIPNGSVESHLHGIDKESIPLDWNARIKIALGAARGLAYLHEDSSPRVIHRDFKSSNILLEHDFTPKVSDFGLARIAMDEENRHISTRVMGTFGYVAPEYAMTGHLLVKSDVYSYGVVLLELITGRKPVDMSQPPGQENLVSWAHPFLTSKEGLVAIIDPSLGPDVPFDSAVKVAAIASMCVQPEASHRPFMGEVVQALKLVCNECDGEKEAGSRSSSQELSIDMDTGVSGGSGRVHPFGNQTTAVNYDSEPDIERALSISELLGLSVSYERQASGSFRLRKCSSSGPLTTERSGWFWRRMRRLRGESVSEHGIVFSKWPGSH